MPYTHDIFLSYAHVDDEAYGDPKGWVSNFFERLKIRLTQMLGQQPEVWWDKRLQDNTYFVGEIADQITGTRFLVSVVTPRYVRSEWCKGELEEFCRRADRNGGLSRNNLSRLFKVEKTPVKKEELPARLREMNGYTFFEFDERMRPREFRQDVAPPNKDQRYWDRIDDLAWDIKQTIDGLGDGGGDDGGGGGGNAGGGGGRGGGPAGDVAVGDEGPGVAFSAAEVASAPVKAEVYLAEAAPDIEGERDRLRRELKHHGFGVLPEGALPRRAQDLVGLVRESLARSALSVHMLGAGYGDELTGVERSVVVLQEELAAQRAAEDPTFSRVIWVPHGLDPEDLRQRNYIARLQAGLGPRAEFLQTGVEGLKTRILEKLNAPRPEPKADPGGGRALVYLMHDGRDAEAAGAVAAYVRERGCAVVTSGDAGGEQAARHHRQSLGECDAAVIYFGAADPLWLYTKVWDVQKAEGWGRPAPLRTAAVYMGAPRTPEKDDFPSDDLLVIRGFEAQVSDGLRPLLMAAQMEGRSR